MKYSFLEKFYFNFAHWLNETLMNLPPITNAYHRNVAKIKIHKQSDKLNYYLWCCIKYPNSKAIPYWKSKIYKILKGFIRSQGIIDNNNILSIKEIYKLLSNTPKFLHSLKLYRKRYGIDLQLNENQLNMYSTYKYTISAIISDRNGFELIEKFVDEI